MRVEDRLTESIEATEPWAIRESVITVVRSISQLLTTVHVVESRLIEIMLKGNPPALTGVDAIMPQI